MHMVVGIKLITECIFGEKLATHRVIKNRPFTAPSATNANKLPD